jgi:hypothetical protein
MNTTEKMSFDDMTVDGNHDENTTADDDTVTYDGCTQGESYTQGGDEEDDEQTQGTTVRLTTDGKFDFTHDSESSSSDEDDHDTDAVLSDEGEDLASSSDDDDEPDANTPKPATKGKGKEKQTRYRPGDIPDDETVFDFKTEAEVKDVCKINKKRPTRFRITDTNIFISCADAGPDENDGLVPQYVPVFIDKKRPVKCEARIKVNPEKLGMEYVRPALVMKHGSVTLPDLVDQNQMIVVRGHGEMYDKIAKDHGLKGPFLIPLCISQKLDCPVFYSPRTAHYKCLVTVKGTSENPDGSLRRYRINNRVYIATEGKNNPLSPCANGTECTAYSINFPVDETDDEEGDKAWFEALNDLYVILRRDYPKSKEKGMVYSSSERTFRDCKGNTIEFDSTPAYRQLMKATMRAEEKSKSLAQKKLTDTRKRTKHAHEIDEDDLIEDDDEPAAPPPKASRPSRSRPETPTLPKKAPPAKASSHPPAKKAPAQTETKHSVSYSVVEWRETARGMFNAAIPHDYYGRLKTMANSSSSNEIRALAASLLSVVDYMLHSMLDRLKARDLVPPKTSKSRSLVEWRFADWLRADYVFETVIVTPDLFKRLTKVSENDDTHGLLGTCILSLMDHVSAHLKIADAFRGSEKRESNVCTMRRHQLVSSGLSKKKIQSGEFKALNELATHSVKTTQNENIIACAIASVVDFAITHA